jgi:hypothetical protein
VAITRFAQHFERRSSAKPLGRFDWRSASADAPHPLRLGILIGEAIRGGTGFSLPFWALPS